MMYESDPLPEENLTFLYLVKGSWQWDLPKGFGIKKLLL